MSSKSFQDIVRNATDISSDSRKITKGAVYVAVHGTAHDGHDYIAQAIEKGAQTIIHSADYKVPDILSGKASFISHDNTRKALALCAAAFYRQQPDHIVAVTGTNGKSSVAHFTQQFWQQAGLNAASLGTLGIHSSLYKQAGSLTTPDPVGLHKILSDLKSRDISHLAMEASSHGLHQYRLDGVKLKAAGFTNLTRDHLDYHKTERAYFEAKKRLFSELLPAHAIAAINQDAMMSDELIAICESRKHRLVRYGTKGTEIIIRRLTPQPHGLTVAANIFGSETEIELPLVGAFQAFNIFCAFGLSGMEAGQIEWDKINGVDGRMERVGLIPDKQAAIYVDYAHTPDALETILKALRPHLIGQGKLHLVFGCGGDRDKGKRPEMGKIAALHADSVIVTDDNPRHENSANIRQAIIESCPNALEIGDRAKAIETALNQLKQHDILVVAGKGHESGQTIGDQTIPFSDKSVIQTMLGALQQQNNPDKSNDSILSQIRGDKA